MSTEEIIEGDVIHVTEQIANTWVGSMMPVRVLDGAGTGVTMDEGYVLGYLDSPSLLLLHEDGTTASWSTRLPWQYIGRPTPRWRQEELIRDKQPRIRHGLPGEAPRQWSLPPEPWPEVTRLEDRDGTIWARRAGDAWEIDGDDPGGYEFDVADWPLLLSRCFPLTDVSPLSEEKGEGQ